MNVRSVLVLCAVCACVPPTLFAATARHATRAVPASSQPLPASAEDSAAARRAIDAGNDGYIAAWKARDAAAFAALFAPDGALLQTSGRMIRGREAIRERMAAVMQKVGMVEGTIMTRDVFLFGDTAYETGKWRFTMVGEDGKAEPDSGHYVEVWRRQPGGEWKMWRDIGVAND